MKRTIFSILTLFTLTLTMLPSKSMANPQVPCGPITEGNQGMAHYTDQNNKPAYDLVICAAVKADPNTKAPVLSKAGVTERPQHDNYDLYQKASGTDYNNGNYTWRYMLSSNVSGGGGGLQRSIYDISTGKPWDGSLKTFTYNGSYCRATTKITASIKMSSGRLESRIIVTMFPSSRLLGSPQTIDSGWQPGLASVNFGSPGSTWKFLSATIIQDPGAAEVATGTRISHGSSSLSPRNNITTTYVCVPAPRDINFPGLISP